MKRRAEGGPQGGAHPVQCNAVQGSVGSVTDGREPDPGLPDVLKLRVFISNSLYIRWI